MESSPGPRRANIIAIDTFEPGPKTMRTPPRRRRALRPELLSLEAICPVSSLATTLTPLATVAISAPKPGDTAAHRIAPRSRC